jgi:hypothetical protein
MISHMPSNLRSAASFLFVAVVYWLCLWRIIKGNRGNRVVQCGCITLMLSFLMMLLMKVAKLPDWVLSSLGMLIFLLCLLTMFFLLLRGVQLSGDAIVSPSIALAKRQIAAQREDFASGYLTQSRQTSI